MFKVFQFQENKINVFGREDKMFFYASQISKAIGYIDTTDSIRKHVWTQNKMTIEDYKKNNLGQIGKPGENDTLTRQFENINKSTILLSVAGIFQLIYCSKLPNAITFHDWFRKEILQNLRQKVSSPLELKHNQFVILNEADIQMKTVDYLRTFYPDVLFHTSSTNEMLNTPEKRIDIKKMGFCSGMPDLIVYENSKHHNGLTIEFKSPKGTGIVSQSQTDVNNKLSNRGYLPIISDNYDQIIFEINNYLSNRRLKCCHCNIKCKSTENLKTHILNFHKK